MAPLETDKSGKTPVPKHKASLGLVSGARPQRLTVALTLHFLSVLLPYAFVFLPIRIAWHHLIMRWRSPLVQVIGRPFYADFVVKISQFILSRFTIAQSRLVFNRKQAYSLAHKSPVFKGYRDWVTYVNVAGTSGRWIAQPGTKRSDDEVVLYYIHGGGFVFDTAGNVQVFFMELAKELKLRRNVQFSVFCLDYELAPEFKYPSQLIEILAGYHHLVNELGITEDKICIAGDSAGGNLATTFLLHLARPNPKIKVPESLGPTPGRPGSAFIISPMVNMVSHTGSRKKNEKYDYIENGGAFRIACDYIGVAPPSDPIPSLNPWQFVRPLHKGPPRTLMPGRTPWKQGQEEGTGMALFESPYVNPSVQKDSDWWKDACPPNGRTMVIWGGAEIFSDDVEAFVRELEKAGVEPQKLYKQHGAHNWVLHDTFIPGVFSTHSALEDRQFGYNVEATATFLQEADIARRQKYWASVAEKKGDSGEGKPSAQAKQELEGGLNDGKKEKEAGLKVDDAKKTAPAQAKKAEQKIDSAKTAAKETAPKSGNAKKA